MWESLACLLSACSLSATTFHHTVPDMTGGPHALPATLGAECFRDPCYATAGVLGLLQAVSDPGALDRPTCI